MSTQSPYLTYEQATAEFGVSISTITRRVRAGVLTRHKSFKDTRKVLLSRRELQEAFTFRPVELAG